MRRGLDASRGAERRWSSAGGERGAHVASALDRPARLLGARPERTCLARYAPSGVPASPERVSARPCLGRSVMSSTAACRHRLEVIRRPLRPLLRGVDVAPEQELVTPHHPDVNTVAARRPVDRDAHCRFGFHVEWYPLSRTTSLDASGPRGKRAEGIEPSSVAWKAAALPLSYAREEMRRTLAEAPRGRRWSTSAKYEAPGPAPPERRTGPRTAAVGRRIPYRHEAGQSWRQFWCSSLIAADA